MMTGPDVRWDGVSHEQIVDWVNKGHGAAVTEILEARLRSVTEVLSENANLVNSVLQKVNGGEWTGAAATVAAQAMQVLRDFDDTMRHHGEMNNLAALGQSDNSSWVRTNVPPVVDLWPALLPTGGPSDVLGSTVDFQHQLQAAKDAEEQARQVMREYETMTVERVASLPPLSPAPQVVVSGMADTIVVKPVAPLPPRDSRPDKDDGQGQGVPVADEPQAPPDTDRGPGDRRVDVGPSGHGPASESPHDESSPDGSSRTASSSSQSDLPVGGRTGGAGETPRPTGGVANGVGLVDGLGADGGRGPSRGGPGEPRIGEPGVRRGLADGVETFGRGRQGGTTGVTPVGASRPQNSDEDKKHQVKYRVPRSEIFEPDNDDGLLHDPFRPGSFVVPGSIGDDDEE